MSALTAFDRFSVRTQLSVDAAVAALLPAANKHDNVLSKLRGFAAMFLEQPIPILDFDMTYFVDIDPRIMRFGLHAGRLQAGG